MKSIRFFSLILLVAVLASCYESSMPLSDPNEKIDGALLGIWKCVPEPAENTDETAVLRIFRYEDIQYYAEWQEADDHITRYRAYPSVVNGTTVLNVQELSQQDKGGTWSFLRYRTADDKTMHMAIVNEKAVKSSTEAQALQEIRKRASEQSLYKTFASCRKPEERTP